MSRQPDDYQPPFAETISMAARTQLEHALTTEAGPSLDCIEEMRQDAVARGAIIARRRKERYGVRIEETCLGSVPAYLVTPGDFGGDASAGPLLINLHGGGFVIDYAALPESIPIAALSGVAVVSIRYRLAPEHPYPAAVDDALAVYLHALETRRPHQVALFGTSAGAILAVQLLARLKAESIPMPAAAGLFSVTADFARAGDSEGFLPPLAPGHDMPGILSHYRGDADPRDPLVSPIFGDLTCLPPILLMTSTRDQLLSQTVLLHEALLAADVPVTLRVFEGMLHAFWTTLEGDESNVALAAQANFLRHHLESV